MVFLQVRQLLHRTTLRSNILRRMKASTSETRPCKEEEDEILFETENSRGIITLNKPRVLNCINMPMVLQIMEKLETWEETMDLVIIKGAGGKAFCAGGDIVQVTKAGKDNSSEGKRFFRSEYLMNNLIGTYKIPYIALIDGITMGGGVGLSVHGRYRVATERTLFAMPETAIGLFPDVGGGYFLPRLRGKLGLYLALTGHRLKGTDVVKAGVATHYCESEHLPQLYNALIKMDTPVSNIEEDIFNKYTKNIHSIPFSLETRMSEINRIFCMPTIEKIMEELEKAGSEWALSTLATLKKMSPISLKVTQRQIQLGETMNLQQVLQMENRIAGAALEARVSNDFYEGVRALLVDKDKKPQWDPSCLEDITEEMVECVFKPLDSSEELTT